MISFTPTEGTRYYEFRPNLWPDWRLSTADRKFEWMGEVAASYKSGITKWGVMFHLSERELETAPMQKLAYNPLHDGYPVRIPGVGVGMFWVMELDQVQYVSNSNENLLKAFGSLYSVQFWEDPE